MKKYTVFFFVILFIACSNTASEKKTLTTNNPENQTADNSKKESSCADLLFFKKGAVIESATYDSADTNIYSSSTTVTNVRTNEGVKTADIEIKMIGGMADQSVLKVSYTCDGNNLAVDMNSMLANFKALAGAKTSISPMLFPADMAVGQDLPAATSSVTLERGERVTKITTTVKDRKVEAKESVTTPAGTWQCYRISAIMDADINMGGGEKEKMIADMMKKKMPVKKYTVWFNDVFGIVKTANYENNKLTSRTEITSIKK